MRGLTRCAVLLIGGVLAPLSAHAVNVTTAELPASIQSCITSNTCQVIDSSIYDSGTASAFLIFNAGQTGFNYLVRYALAAPSGASGTALGQPSTFTPFGGYLWMQVQESYSASQSADPISLYLDKVAPALTVPPPPYTQTSVLSLNVSAADLLAGSSYVNAGLNASDQSYVSGDLSGNLPEPCAAQGCSMFAQLNLSQLVFTQYGTIIFNPLDSRTLVFDMGTADNGSVSGYPYSSTWSFYVSAVPEPQAAWQFTSGLACLAVVMRRKRAVRSAA